VSGEASGSTRHEKYPGLKGEREEFKPAYGSGGLRSMRRLVGSTASVQRFIARRRCLSRVSCIWPQHLSLPTGFPRPDSLGPKPFYPRFRQGTFWVESSQTVLTLSCSWQASSAVWVTRPHFRAMA
jgi:hypothetical protein